MQITFISWATAFATLGAVLVMAVVYFKFLRPKLAVRPEFHDAFERHDSWLRGAGAWLKVRWSMTLAAAMVALPIVWNGALDAIVALSQLLDQAAPALANADLSWLILPVWLKTTLQVAGPMLPVLRTMILAKRGA